MRRKGALTSVALLSILALAPLPAAAQSLVIDGLPAETKPLVAVPSNLNRYSLAFHGVVADTVTDLVWLANGACDELPGIGPLGITSWSAALKAVALLEDGVCGLEDGSQAGDWRLPTAEEWSETIDRATQIGCTVAGVREPPSLTNRPGTDCHEQGPAAFQDVGFFYWSSTLDDVNPDQAWSVNLANGAVSSAVKISLFAIWPVRDAP